MTQVMEKIIFLRNIISTHYEYFYCSKNSIIIFFILFKKVHSTDDVFVFKLIFKGKIRRKNKIMNSFFDFLSCFQSNEILIIDVNGSLLIIYYIKIISSHIISFQCKYFFRKQSFRIDSKIFHIYNL